MHSMYFFLAVMVVFFAVDCLISRGKCCKDGCGCQK